MKRSREIFVQDPVFTNIDGNTLLLSKIVETKKITKVVIGYLTKNKSIPDSNWFLKLLGFKKEFQEKKELVIYDKSGILFDYKKGIESVSIRFSSKEEFNQLTTKNYDETTLWKRYIYTVHHPYQINFHIGNLKKVEWTDKLMKDF
ncbi:MAG: hypothetical protein JJE53_02230 [Candidatus Pacebacteria bacterium]|nr:hypothetical protein [Candidatus Paceibacterota bacterium]